MKANIYFCNCGNYGDQLNKYIFKKFAKIDTIPNWIENFDKILISGIGSVLNYLLYKDEKKYYKLPIIIFSSGLGWLWEGEKEILMKNVKCFALRGKLTLERMQKMLNSPLKDVVIGDGGLLASYLIDTTKVKKKYRLGIIPHYPEKDDEIFKKIQSNIKESIILDTQKDPIEFLYDMAQCEAIISTAMHPLIAADSLGIPNKWVRANETTTLYKFYDYYSVYSTSPPPQQYAPQRLFEKIFDENDLKLLHENYNIKKEEVEKIKKDLIIALKKVKIEYIKEVFKFKLYKIFIKLISMFIFKKSKRKEIRKKLLETACYSYKL